MAAWEEIYSAAELTGFARAAFDHYDSNDSSSFSRFLPNEYRFGNTVEFVVGDSGLMDEARFRAYDAEPEIAGAKRGRRVSLLLPAAGQQRNVSESEQLRALGLGDDVKRQVIEQEVVKTIYSIVNLMERQRVSVLLSGKATIDQVNFKVEDDFGRDPALTHTEATLWNTSTAGRLDSLAAMAELYQEKSGGFMPGVMVMTPQAFRLLKAGDDFKTATGKAMTGAEINQLLQDEGLPTVELYSRATARGPILPSDRLLMLPAPSQVGGVAQQDLGRTYWGQTLTSTQAEYAISEADQPGIVSVVFKGVKPPHIAEVVSDAIGMPVLENANLSLAAKIA